MIFNLHDVVKHSKGSIYIITETPNHKKLEYCNESFYEYQNLYTNEVWIRRKTEFEDGRFKLA